MVGILYVYNYIKKYGPYQSKCEHGTLFKFVPCARVDRKSDFFSFLQFLYYVFNRHLVCVGFMLIHFILFLQWALSYVCRREKRSNMIFFCQITDGILVFTMNFVTCWILMRSNSFSIIIKSVRKQDTEIFSIPKENLL